MATTHFAAVCALFVIGFLRFLPLMLNGDAGGYACETIYVESAEALLAGRSPYVWGYLYPPSLAIVGAAIIKVSSTGAFIWAFRYTNLLGGCVAIWMSLHWTGLSLRWRFAAALALVLAWPPLASGIVEGNISPLVTGLTLWSLASWKRNRVGAGTALGWALALKPTSALALGMLPLFGRFSAEHRRAALWTVGIAGGWCVLFMALGAPYLHDMANSIDPQAAAAGNTSIFRVLYLLGVVVPPVLLMAAVGAIASYVAYRSPADDAVMTCVIACHALLSMPIVWVFTLLLALPVQCQAMARAVRGYRSTRSERDLAVLLAVVWGNVLIAFSEDYGGLDVPYRWMESLLVAAPLVALGALTVYAVHAPRLAAATVTAQR